MLNLENMGISIVYLVYLCHKTRSKCTRFQIKVYLNTVSVHSSIQYFQILPSYLTIRVPKDYFFAMKLNQFIGLSRKMASAVQIIPGIKSDLILDCSIINKIKSDLIFDNSQLFQN